jgi:hypothetical protein
MPTPQINDEILDDLTKDVIRDYIKDHLRDVTRLRELRIHGIEVTQSIQYYHANEHLTDPADQGPDNSLRLVAYKAAWVRVYLRGLLQPIEGVTGTVDVERQIFGKIWDKVMTLNAEPPGSVTAEINPPYPTERGDIDSTLNFIIPASEMWGYLRLHIQVSDGTHADTITTDIDVTLRQTMRLAGIMVGYNGPNAAGTTTISLTAPVLADLQNTSAWTLTTYPISAVTYRVVSTITLTNPLNDQPSCNGCCTPHWSDLIADLAAEKIADGAQPGDVYFGLLTNGIPMGPIIGCASSFVGSGGNGDEVTMAHELGHQLGFGHSPCGVGGEAGYPAYEPYDPAGISGGSIGEYGLDINNGDVKSPANHKCYMSYCGPKWMSLNRYSRLIQHSDLNPDYVGIWRIWWREWLRYDPRRWIGPNPPPFKVRIFPMDVISIIGVMNRQTIRVKTVVRIPTHVDTSLLIPLPITAELVDAKGGVLASGPVYRLPQRERRGEYIPYNEAGEPDTFVIQAFIPNVASGARLRLIHHKENREIWSINAPEKEPQIESFKARVAKNGMLAVSLAVSHSVKKPEFWVRWSDDKGQTWHPLQARLPLETSGKMALDISPATVPAGDVLLQLVITDGFFTTLSDPIKITVPRQPPVVSILHPQQDQVLLANHPMRLWAIINDNAGRPIPLAKCQWLIDGKKVSDGTDVWITAPSAGRHTCLMRVDIDNEKIEKTIEFETVVVASSR